jgi:AP2-associated kinase
MKKIFSKFENKNEEKTSSNFSSNFVGKVFVVGKVTVVVEDILAEGNFQANLK